jgi:hypothetical protein
MKFCGMDNVAGVSNSNVLKAGPLLTAIWHSEVCHWILCV